jgi:hypothetical protein
MIAYETAEAHWPDQPAALLGQGNIAYTNQNLQKATNDFFRMVKKFPQAAEGCKNEAEKARQCALALAPERFDQPLAPTSSASASCHAVPDCSAHINSLE